MTYTENETIKFEALPGYFASFAKSDSKAVNSTEIDHNEIINHDGWKQLFDSIPEDTENTKYKLLILARHGQGYHNAAIIRYGQKRWDEYWSLLDGDENGSWVDSRLTPLGKEQVSETGKEFLLPIVSEIGIVPHKYFISPMRRCLETYAYSWSHVFNKYPELIDGQQINNTVIENLRETLGEHTCDKRINHSETVDEYQNFKTESGHTIKWLYEDDYSEEDDLWLADHRETAPEMDVRIHKGLEQLFNMTSSDDRFLSLTCHEGVINSTLRNLNHPGVQKIQTGRTVAVVVKLTTK